MPTLAPPRIGCFCRLLVGRFPEGAKPRRAFLRTGTVIIAGLMSMACQTLPSLHPAPARPDLNPAESEASPDPGHAPLLWDGLNRGKREAMEVGHA